MRSHGVHFASYYFYKRNSLHTLNTFDSTSTTIMRRMWVIVGVVWCLFFDSNDRSFKCKLASKRRCKRNCDVFPFKVLCKWMRGFEWSTLLMINIVHIGLFSLCFWVLMWYNPWKLNCKCFKPILEVCVSAIRDQILILNLRTCLSKITHGLASCLRVIQFCASVKTHLFFSLGFGFVYHQMFLRDTILYSRL